MYEFFKELTNPESIINYGGLALLLFVLFAETGLFFGFFLPGDSLVFIAGMICVSKPYILNVNIAQLIIFLSGAAILGNIVGYWFGYKVGVNLFKKKDSFFFKRKYLKITGDFYSKHGGISLMLGRFLPIVRTFSPILAGVIKLDFKKFMLYNMVGALGWIGSLAGIGYFLGSYKWVQENVEYFLIGLIILTIIPFIVGIGKKKT